MRLAAVPNSDFLTFRADARNVLSPEDFALADAVYASTFELASCRLGESEETVSQFLYGQLVGTDDANRRTVIIRAAQAAAFRSGQLLDVDLDGVLRAVGETASLLHLRPEQWVALRSARPAPALGNRQPGGRRGIAEGVQGASGP